MENLTVREQVVVQLKRAPSFAFAACVMAVALMLSALVTFSIRRPPALPAMSFADIAEDEPDDVLPKLRPRPDPIPHKVEMPKLEPREWVREPAREEGVEKPWNQGAAAPQGLEMEPGATDHVKRFRDMSANMAVIAAVPTRHLKGWKGMLGSRDYDLIGEGGIGGMPGGTVGSIDWGLRWLAQAQDKKTGAWYVKRWGGSSQESVAGVTGLALLAFLARGCTDAQPQRYTKTVRKAVEFLVSQQRSEGADRGSFGARMYSQGICTMALSEASVLLQSPRLKGMARRSAQKGIDYIVARQAEHGGFGYTGPGNDTSVTGWQVMAIKSAHIAGLRLPESATTRTENFLQASLASDGSTPYRFNPSGGSSGGTPRMTAVALTARLFMGHKRNDEDCVRQVNWLVAGDRHLAVAAAGADLYHIYYTSMAMFHIGGKHWRAWNKTFNSGVRARQVKAGPDRGSWPVAGSPYGPHGGRVYTTAMACLSLEVYVKHLPLYKM